MLKLLLKTKTLTVFDYVVVDMLSDKKNLM